jgi:hypothetical protein
LARRRSSSNDLAPPWRSEPPSASGLSSADRRGPATPSRIEHDHDEDLQPRQRRRVSLRVRTERVAWERGACRRRGETYTIRVQIRVQTRAEPRATTSRGRSPQDDQIWWWIGTAYRIRTGDLRLERAVSWASRRMRRRRAGGCRQAGRHDTSGPLRPSNPGSRPTGPVCRSPPPWHSASDWRGHWSLGASLPPRVAAGSPHDAADASRHPAWRMGPNEKSPAACATAGGVWAA